MLDQADLRVELLQLHQPSLDDVFLAKTGRKLEGAGEEPEDDEPARGAGGGAVVAEASTVRRRSRRSSRSARSPAGRSRARSASAALLVFPLLFPLILFAINGSALSAATKIPGFPISNYRDFALALPFIQGALFVSISAGTDLARDIETGFFNRLALTPLRGDGAAGRPARRRVRGRGGAVRSSTCWSGSRPGVGIAQRRRRRARPARPLDADRVRVREPRAADRAALRLRRGGPGDLPAALRARVPQLLEPAAQPDQGATGSARSRPTTRSRT